MKGYKTIVVMGMGLLYALLAGTGVIIPESEQAALSAGAVSLAGIILRFFTDTKVGES